MAAGSPTSSRHELGAKDSPNRGDPKLGERGWIGPVVFLSMISPILDIGMRIGVPMRAFLRGNAPLENTYTVYFDVAFTSKGTALV